MPKKNTSKISKEELKKADPNLQKPTQDIEQNLAEGRDDIVPDPDNVPGGEDFGYVPRPDIISADAQGLQEQKEKVKPNPKKINP